MPFADEVASEAQTTALQQERDRLKSQLARAVAENAELRNVAGLIERTAGTVAKPPRWTVPAKPKHHTAIACSMLSDLHLDEVVRPEEVGGVNAYDRQIATMRLERWAKGFVDLTHNYLAGVDYTGAVVFLGGDMFSGSIHDELVETNEDTLFGSLLYWVDHLHAALEVVSQHYPKLHVPCVHGNHGRMTRKPRAKLAARDNVDWLLYHMLAQRFAHRPEVTFAVTDSVQQLVPVYDTVHLLAHGDKGSGFSGGNGIAGIWSPIMRGLAKKRQRFQFDVGVLGHWHQLCTTPGLIVNGSMKGFDEYAANILNAPPERAQQALWIVTPERGISWQAGIHCDDRKAEGW